MRKTIPNAKSTPFDATEVFKSKIEPKIDEIIKLCTVFKIPIFITACTKNTASKSSYENYAVTADTRELVLADDNIQKHMCITLGYDTIYRAEEEFDYEGSETEKDGD